ncbi:MAG: NAD-dependent epimerase/dehydratase family protein [Aestuariivirgaceae bacterium]
MARIIALTGGSGFVGRRLIPRLAATGAQIRILARTPEGLGKAVQGCVVVPGDLADEAALAQLVTGAGAVIHVAGAISAPDRAAFDRTNVAGTATLAKIAGQCGVSRFVHLSSMAAREPELSDYAASKRAGETALLDQVGETSWTILRPPAVYGPGDKATLPLIMQLTRRHAFLPGAPNNRASLIHVDDLADALIALASGSEPNGTVHEIDDGHHGGYSWHELAQIAGRAQGIDITVHHVPRPLLMAAAQGAALITKLTGKPAMLSPGKVRELYHPDWVARHDLLQKHSDWRAKVDFASGVEMTLDWYRRHQWLPVVASTARNQNKTDQSETTT